MRSTQLTTAPNELAGRPFSGLRVTHSVPQNRVKAPSPIRGTWSRCRWATSEDWLHRVPTLKEFVNVVPITL